MTELKKYRCEETDGSMDDIYNYVEMRAREIEIVRELYSWPKGESSEKFVARIIADTKKACKKPVIEFCANGEALDTLLNDIDSAEVTG